MILIKKYKKKEVLVKLQRLGTNRQKTNLLENYSSTIFLQKLKHCSASNSIFICLALETLHLCKKQLALTFIKIKRADSRTDNRTMVHDNYHVFNKTQTY